MAFLSYMSNNFNTVELKGPNFIRKKIIIISQPSLINPTLFSNHYYLPYYQSKKWFKFTDQTIQNKSSFWIGKDSAKLFDGVTKKDRNYFCFLKFLIIVDKGCDEVARDNTRHPCNNAMQDGDRVMCTHW